MGNIFFQILLHRVIINPEFKKGIYGSLAKLINVSKDYEKKAGFMKFILIPTKKIKEQLEEKGINIVIQNYKNFE